VFLESAGGSLEIDLAGQTVLDGEEICLFESASVVGSFDNIILNNSDDPCLSATLLTQQSTVSVIFETSLTCETVAASLLTTTSIFKI